jgi:hypothetical protein
MRALPFVASFVAITSLAAAQDTTARPSPTRNAAWQRFQQEVGGQWLVQWNAATDTPRAVYGSGAALAGWRGNDLAEARRHALAALQRHGDLLGLGDSTFTETIGARMGRTWSFTFAQSFRGLPVLGGRADVRIHMVGRLAYLGSTAVPVPADFDVAPKLDEANAVRLAWLGARAEPNGVPQPGSPAAPRLVIHADVDGSAAAVPTLAWEVPIRAVDAAGNGPLGRGYVDARTGAWLGWIDDKHACGATCATGGAGATNGDHRPAAAPLPPATYTVTGFTHTGFSPVSTPVNVPLPGVEITVPGVGTVVTDQNGQFTADLTTPTSVTVRLDGIHSRLISGANALDRTQVLQPGVPAVIQLGSAASSEQQLAHTTTYWWIHRVNEFARSILGALPELAFADQVQAQVNINAACNAYYVGNSVNFYASGGGCNNTSGASVIAHEWGHGLDDRFGGISQVNGLSEGWGDICSMYLLDDPTIGHDFFQGGGGIRTGTNNRQYPGGGGPHAQGESWMGFAWKFRQNLRAALGTAAAIQVSNDVVLGSIVANAVDQQNAVLQAFLADDDDGNLANGTPHHAWLAAACTTHNLPFPAIQAGLLLHTPLAQTGQQATPRRVEVAAIPSFGAFTNVRLHWNDGQLRQRDMIPSGTADGWHAMLPGMMAPQTVRYWIEAVHQNGAVLRLPTSGDYGYVTLADAQVWFDGFETGGPGWTHGATTGTDDWEIGAPAGRSGAGWRDPAAAASGSQCAGTDLGGAGDGAYARGRDRWLRTPPIDCTGRSNLWLRCKRWISVESQLQDRMEVRANGIPVWLNAQVPTFDTAWVTLQAQLAMASNHPALVLEFRLQSNATFEFGGWNLDDVEVYTTVASVPLPAELRLLPEQARQGAPLQLTVRTAGPLPFLLVIGDQPGPTAIPGVPLLAVGGSYLTLPAYTDALGTYSLPLGAPSPVAATGLLWYSQVLTLDANLQLVVSNLHVTLVTP